MATFDLMIVLIYIGGLFAFAVYTGLRQSVADFLVLSRKAPFALVTFSVISTWVGVGTTVVTAASGYDTGVSLGVTAGVGGLVGVLAAALFAPTLKSFGDRFGAHTLGDFFAVRYSRVARIVVACFILIIYVMLTAAQFVALATLVETWSGLGFLSAVILAALTTIVYTAFAGIKSDFYTDAVHFVVMVVVFFGVLLPVVSTRVGGVASLRSLPSSYFDPFAYGGVSFFAAGVVFGVGMVFVTMEVWQRIYAARSAATARLALVVSGIVIVGFYAVSAFFGMSGKVLEPNLSDRDQVLFVLMRDLLPSGVLGLGIAGFIAAVISTVNSTMMVASATITKDIFKGHLRPKAEDAAILRAGRLATLGVGLSGLAVAMLVPDLVTLSVNALFMLLILFPPVIGGFFWRKATAKGALTAIVAGLVTCLVFFAVDATTAFVPGFLVSLFSLVAVSHLTAHDDSENLSVRVGQNIGGSHQH